jgi:hypothetical protein
LNSLFCDKSGEAILIKLKTIKIVKFVVYVKGLHIRSVLQYCKRWDEIGKVNRIKKSVSSPFSYKVNVFTHLQYYIALC